MIPFARQPRPPRGAILLPPRSVAPTRPYVYAVELRSGIHRIYWRQP